MILSLDSKSLQRLANSIDNIFWKEVVLTWGNIVEVDRSDEIQKILNYTIWNSWYIRNPNLKRLGEMLWHVGCQTVADLYDNDLRLLTFEGFTDKFLQINFMDYASLMASLPEDWKRTLNMYHTKPAVIENDLQFNIISRPKTCKVTYKLLIDSLPLHRPNEAKWEGLLNANITEEEWQLYYSLPYTCTYSTKLQSFQYRILHRVIGVNKWLKRWGIVESELCGFCSRDIETITHLFVDCPKVKQLWEDVRLWLHAHVDIGLVNTNNIIFGDASGVTKNFIILLVKYYIYTTKMREKSLSLEGIKAAIKSEYIMELHISQTNGRMKRSFEEKWGSLSNLCQ